MAETRPGTGLQTLFAIFLGLMVTAFVGVGVYTFYPPPDKQYREQIIKLDRQQQAIANSRTPDALTPAERAQMQKIADQRNKLQDLTRASNEAWGGRTSIILVVLATLAMAISLIAASQLPVISNGLLMGGVFTMLYGVGWVIVSGTSTTRFIVMSFALLITLGLGYMRFVRRRASGVGEEAPTGGAVVGSGGIAELELRVRTLENRIQQVATALTANS